MNESIGSYFLNVPYPPVEVEGRNTYYASLLTEDYAGQVSELTAITSYIFQHLICCDSGISQAVRAIAMVEMRHLDMVGQLIHLFGGCPRTGADRSGRMFWWSGQFTRQETDPGCFLKANILMETATIREYRQRIAQIHDEPARDVLRRIILDEEHHIHIFNCLLDEIN